MVSLPQSASLDAVTARVGATREMTNARSSERAFCAVDPRRFELLTSSMRTRRATNCAKGPFTA